MNLCTGDDNIHPYVHLSACRKTNDEAMLRPHKVVMEKEKKIKRFSLLLSSNTESEKDINRFWTTAMGPHSIDQVGLQQVRSPS